MRTRLGENSRMSKSHNRGVVLRLIATGEATTRIDLAKRTGLVKMTLSNIVGEFLERGLIVETSPKVSDSLGRNPIELAIAPTAPKAIGVNIARRKIQVTLTTLDLKILKTKAVRFESLTKEELIETVFAFIDEMLAEETNILGIGVTCVGPMDMQKGEILSPPMFYGIENVPLKELLTKRYDYPIVVEHDHNFAALTELLFGAGRGVNDLIYVGLGTGGISSGIIVGGEIIFNSKRYESELGHISIQRDGKECVCGNKGCLEAYATKTVVHKELIKATGKTLSFEEFAAMEDDPRVNEIFLEMTYNITTALIGIVNILHPELILLGRNGVFLRQCYLDYMQEHINALKFVKDDRPILVKKAYFDDKNRAIGAACGVIATAFKGEILF